MDLLTSNIRPMYYKYLAASFGSALISSIYGIVDMAMVGQYHGPEGTAALATVAPLWNVIYSLGMLTGIGGAVLLSNLRGQSAKNLEKSNEYYTASLIGTLTIALIVWLSVIFFDTQILQVFGAEGELLVMAKRYVFPVKFVVPVFMMNTMLAAFIRNDGNPALATWGTLIGGVFNVFGDWFFVFRLDMGIMGAGLATGMGAVISFLVLLTHFFSKKRTIHLVKVTNFGGKIRKICTTGFSTFFVDVAMGILTILFNRQILHFLGTDALSIYAVIINISTFVQCCAYSVGQAAQPILSMNYGAGKWGRIRETLKYALYAVAAFSLFWTVLNFAVPEGLIRIFMKPTASVLAIAPAIIRKYSISYLLLPLNIFSTYYFQALLKPKAAFIVSVGRGMLVSGAMILLLPVILGADSLWFAMPITELVIAVYVISRIRKFTQKEIITIN